MGITFLVKAKLADRACRTLLGDASEGADPKIVILDDSWRTSGCNLLRPQNREHFT